MTKEYQGTEFDTSALAVPEQVSGAMSEIAADMREGLLALAVGAGLQVMQELMAADVAAACGPRGGHDPGRAATRHGFEAGSLTLGGRRVPVTRPARASDGSGEVPVPAYELFNGTELLGRMAMERMLAGVSTRRYPVALEPVGEQVEAGGRSTSKSAVSRKFVAMTETALTGLLAADLSGLDLVSAIMIDGVHFADHLCVVALGIGIDGTKHPLALVEGSTENTTLVRCLLSSCGSVAWTPPADPGRPGRRQGLVRGGEGGVRPSGDRSLPAPQGPIASKIIYRRSCGAWSAGGCGRRTTPTPRWRPRPCSATLHGL